jgi:aldose 1-epimerase
VNAPTGQQHVLTRGGVRAVITELAAGLRHLSVDGVELVQDYPDDAQAPFCAGIVLVPWPNRIEDGRWVHEGTTLQLDITEPDKNNAIHGLLRNSPYQLVEQTADLVTLAAEVFPQHGYPFHLETSVRYSLTDDGIAVTHEVRNVGASPAPYAVGTHPFLKIGDVPTADLVLTVNAATHIEVDDRLNPVRQHPVEGTRWDLRSGMRVADLDLDDAWGDVQTVDGASAVLRAPDGREVRLLQDAEHKYLQAFITRIFPGAGTAIAVEPMTAPAGAFNTGLGLKWLQPAESWSVGWGIQYSR